MTLNKVFLILILLISSVYFYFDSTVPSDEEINRDDQLVLREDINNERTSSGMVSEFAKSIEENPDFMSVIDSSSIRDVSVEQAITGLAEEKGSLGHNTISEFKKKLFENKKEALPLVFKKFNSVTSEEWHIQQSLLYLAVDLCDSEIDITCSDFLQYQALNPNLNQHQQLLSLRGYLNTSSVSKEEKLGIISTFKNNNSNTEILAEVDSLEEFVRNPPAFVMINDPENNPDRSPANAESDDPDKFFITE
jgi:hypothetical protein